jgi:hypothetical protein
MVKLSRRRSRRRSKRNTRKNTLRRKSLKSRSLKRNTRKNYREKSKRRSLRNRKMKGGVIDKAGRKVLNDRRNRGDLSAHSGRRGRRPAVPQRKSQWWTEGEARLPLLPSMQMEEGHILRLNIFLNETKKTINDRARPVGDLAHQLEGIEADMDAVMEKLKEDGAKLLRADFVSTDREFGRKGIDERKETKLDILKPLMQKIQEDIKKYQYYAMFHERFIILQGNALSPIMDVILKDEQDKSGNALQTHWDGSAWHQVPADQQPAAAGAEDEQVDEQVETHLRWEAHRLARVTALKRLETHMRNGRNFLIYDMLNRLPITLMEFKKLSSKLQARIDALN